jgi:hypothetical protein
MIPDDMTRLSSIPFSLKKLCQVYQKRRQPSVKTRYCMIEVIGVA